MVSLSFLLSLALANLLGCGDVDTAPATPAATPTSTVLAGGAPAAAANLTVVVGESSATLRHSTGDEGITGVASYDPDTALLTVFVTIENRTPASWYDGVLEVTSTRSILGSDAVRNGKAIFALGDDGIATGDEVSAVVVLSDVAPNSRLPLTIDVEATIVEISAKFE